MATFTLTIKYDNDAFQPNPHEEITRMLREVASKVEDGKDYGVCQDINGNTVGGFSL